MIIGSLQIDSRRDSVLWRIDKGPNMLILVGSINLILSNGWENYDTATTKGNTGTQKVFKA